MYLLDTKITDLGFDENDLWIAAMRSALAFA
jgi:hypothetical protein